MEHRGPLRRRLLGAGAGLAAAAAAPVALAQAPAFPSRTLRMISPYAPGGVADPVGRAIAEAMSKDLGQQVIVENRPGANTMIGIGVVANGPPDGYAMAIVTGAMLNNVFLYRRMPYAPADIRTIAVVYEGPYVYLINPAIPAKSLKEFVAWAKGRTKPVTYASIATGSNLHLVPEIFAQEAGIQMTEVPFNGKSGEALMSVMTGDCDLFVTLIAQASPQVKAGKLRALAVTTEKRMDALPDVPTVVEAGFPRTSGSATWGGIGVHSGTPREAVEVLRASIHKAMADPAFVRRFEPLGLVMQRPRSLDEVDRYVDVDRMRWGPVIQRLKLQLD
jgi:tripartite-type tricarboxylate transporter receptor subunit TctC